MLVTGHDENILEYLPNGYAYHKIILDDKGNPIDYIFLNINSAFEKSTHLLRKDILGKRVTEVIPGIQFSEFNWIATYGQIAINGGSREFIQYSHEIKRWYKVNAYSYKEGYFATIFNDITEEKEIENKLREKEKELTEAHVIAKLGRWDFFHLENRLEWSDTIYTIFEKDPKIFNVSYYNFLGLIYPEDRDAVNEAWLHSLKTREAYSIEHRLLMNDGKIKWVKEQCKTEFDKDNKPVHSIGVVQDITDIKLVEENLLKKQREIEKLSYNDHLTKLYNRRFFDIELERLDTKRNLPISIIYGDVNGLKLLNDSFGHSTGDELLIKTAEIIKKACRSDDIIARMGGDEFAILLPKTNKIEAYKIINRINYITSREKIKGVKISISLGLGIKTNEKERIRDIQNQAESYMYSNKMLESPASNERIMQDILDIVSSDDFTNKEYAERITRICDNLSNKPKK